MKTFIFELFGSIDLPSYLAWIVLSIIGAITATLVRNHLTTLKSFPLNAVQLLTVILITFIFIRFSFELTKLTPNAFGAFIIGLSGNEIALAMLKKFLEKKKQEEKPIVSADADDEIGGGGIKNPPKP